MAKFPKTLFVKHEPDDDKGYFIADDTEFVFAEMGEKLKVGVYTLTEVHEVEGVVSSKVVKS